MWISDKKGREIGKKYAEFINGVKKIATLVHEALSTCCELDFGKATSIADQIIKLENDIDIITKDIEEYIERHGYELPFLVEDRYTLQELIDDIADKAEFVARFIKIKNISVPEEIKAKLMEMSKIVETLVHQACDAAIKIDESFSEAYALASKIKDLREDVRAHEFEIYSLAVNSKELSPIDVLVLKERVLALSKMADSAEDMCDKVMAMALKYSK